MNPLSIITFYLISQQFLCLYLRWEHRIFGWSGGCNWKYFTLELSGDSARSHTTFSFTAMSVQSAALVLVSQAVISSHKNIVTGRKFQKFGKIFFIKYHQWNYFVQIKFFINLPWSDSEVFSAKKESTLFIFFGGWFKSCSILFSFIKSSKLNTSIFIPGRYFSL